MQIKDHHTIISRYVEKNSDNIVHATNIRTVTTQIRTTSDQISDQFRNLEVLAVKYRSRMSRPCAVSLNLQAKHDEHAMHMRFL